MYATKPLSLFKAQPEAASAPPPEGRNSGYLVVEGAADEGDDQTTCCWGTCRQKRRVWDLPFPQNRVLTVEYSSGVGEQRSSRSEAVVFVPVPGHPLASNRYYVVVAEGRRGGLVRACSREEDVAMCCFSFCRFVSDAEPRPFDPADVYQQVEVVQRRRGEFTARSVAADGLPPSLYLNKYWEVYDLGESAESLDIGEAAGLDTALRSRHQPSAGGVAAVGRWYCPFFLIREEGVAPREQMKRGAFYEVVLEQRWEPMRGGDSKLLAARKAFVGGSAAEEAKPEAWSSRRGDAYVWFVAAATGLRVGVCTTVWERMLWEQKRGGWVDEEAAAQNGSVLVERFLVKRMDRSVVAAFDFVHHNKVKEEHGV